MSTAFQRADTSFFFCCRFENGQLARSTTILCVTAVERDGRVRLPEFLRTIRLRCQRGNGCFQEPMAGSLTAHAKGNENTGSFANSINNGGDGILEDIV